MGGVINMYDIWKLSPGILLLAVAHIVVLSVASDLNECRNSTLRVPKTTSELMHPDTVPK